MSGLPVDVIIYAVVAVVLVGKLLSVLGKRMGNEDTLRQKPFSFGTNQNQTNVQQATRTTQAEADIEEASLIEDTNFERGESFRALTPYLQNVIRQIANVDKEFETHEFLQGASQAYRFIVTAYAEGNRKKLKPLLSAEVYESFEKAIEERELKQLIVKDVIIDEPLVRIVDASLKEDMTANIEVTIESKQYNSITNHEGQLLEGSPSVANALVENWTFTRNLRSDNPNWLLSAITDSDD